MPSRGRVAARRGRARNRRRAATRRRVERARAALALRELEAAPRLRLAVFLALDDAAVARQEAAGFEHRAQARLVIGQRLADAVAHRAGLAGEAAADHAADDVVLAEPAGDDEGLVEQHAQHRPREIDRSVAAVDGDLAVARLDPYAGDRVLALARGVGAALRIELRFRLGGRHWLSALGALQRLAQATQRCLQIGHGHALLFLRFIAPTSSGCGCCPSCGWAGPL